MEAPANLTDRIKLVFNVAARLVYGRGRFHHITDVMRDRLFWCKFGSGLHSSAPCLLIKHNMNWDQPTSQNHACSRRPSRLSTPFGLRHLICWSFQDRRQNLVNNLSLSPDRLSGTLYRTLSIIIFKSRLKTFFFGLSYNVWTLSVCPCFQLCCV